MWSFAVKKLKVFWLTLLALILVTSNGAMSQSASAISESSPANGWMQIPRSSISSVASPIRANRDAFWDNIIGAQAPLTPETASRAAVTEGALFRPTPEIPKVGNRVVVTASFVDHSNVLSSSRRSVYTEITFSVDGVFENRSSLPVLRGQNITVSIAGGTVLTQTGDTLHYLTQPRGLFVKPNRKYLLVLSYEEREEFYTLAENWDISDGIVRVNTRRGKLRMREEKSSLNGLAISELDQTLNRLLSEQ